MAATPTTGRKNKLPHIPGLLQQGALFSSAGTWQRQAEINEDTKTVKKFPKDAIN
jgi:hypothetical protein